ncbi:YfbM family protein [Paenibacillus ferrarius]|uniref:YfbM family protein n=1 Tax=Paenibacillus ferrarius TaxID=1469647 RepID=UPI003D282D95
MGMIGYLKQISTESLEGVIAGNVNIVEVIYSNEIESNSLDIDKAWHAIHFLLNESAWEGQHPFFNVILGGTKLGDDLGYGPARYLTSEEVKEVALSLSSLSENEIRNRFNPEKMKESDIYPSIEWSEQDDLEYVFSYYKEVKKYYLEASENNSAMLLYIS